ncbi:MAG: hypothetical protein A2Z35_06150 [Actinobacteria bacterium RBG_19FT_COMBO_36_27]|nr:MAG: hypothetical protein A2Z35_06150 [Actinobacteria bacterium RBG_19FT_COMBO_36_27]
MIYSLIEVFKKIHEKKLKEESYTTKIGFDFFEFEDKKFKIYLTLKSAIVYLVGPLDVDKRQKLKNELFNRYKRNVVIKCSVNGFLIPSSYILNEYGITAIVEKKDKEGNIKTEYKRISNRWLFVKNKVFSQYHKVFQYEVESYDPDTNKSITALCNGEVLGKYGLCITFCMNNLAVVTSEYYKAELINYFNGFVLENKMNINKKVTIPCMGWSKNKREFFPYSDVVSFDFTGDSSGYMRNTMKAFEPPKHANLPAYLKKLEYFSKSRDLDFVASSFLAAPLLKLLGIRSYTLNFYGKSLSMKSFAAHVGMSFFSRPSDTKSSGEDTQKVNMAKLSMFHNLPFYVDEVREVDGQNCINIYAIGNETDRHRLNQKGQILEKKTWRTIAITTSESAIYDDSNKSGETNRLLCLPIDCASQLGITNEDDIKEFARINYNFLENNYALIGKPYIKYLIENLEELNSLFNRIKSGIRNNKKSNEYHYMVTAVAMGNYLKNKIFFNRDDIEYSLDIGNDFLSRAEDMKDLDEFRRMHDQMFQFYEINKSFFMHANNALKPAQCYGEVKNGKVYFILGPLKDYLQKNNFNWSNKKVLIEHNMIEYKNVFLDKKAQKRIIINESGIIESEAYEENERDGFQFEDNIVDFPQ